MTDEDENGKMKKHILCGYTGGIFNVSLWIFICRSDIPAYAIYTKHHLGEKQTGQV
jgi:hypothetical protein